MTRLENGYDLNHSYQSFLQMYDGGKMDGADLITVTCTRTPQGCPPNPQFIYVDPSQVAEYFTLAETYTFGDPDIPSPTKAQAFRPSIHDCRDIHSGYHRWRHL